MCPFCVVVAVFVPLAASVTLADRLRAIWRAWPLGRVRG
jgi:hypothetical protein